GPSKVSPYNAAVLSVVGDATTGRRVSCLPRTSTQYTTLSLSAGFYSSSRVDAVTTETTLMPHSGWLPLKKMRAAHSMVKSAPQTHRAQSPPRRMTATYL
ncbi:unnamed protein product, partial [Ectocarpus fasciculatus]